MSRKDILNETHIGSDVPFDKARPFIIRRIERNINKLENGCWEWKAWKNWLGYGEVTIQGKCWFVHRLSYTVFKGEFDKKLDICHTCDNRACCNPNHLWVGTHTENMDDHIKKGRHFEREQTHCWRGHPLFGDNMYRARTGGRRCRACEKIRRSPGYVPRKSRKLQKAS